MKVYRIIRQTIRANGEIGHASPLSQPTRHLEQAEHAMKCWADVEGATWDGDVLTFPRSSGDGTKTRMWIETTG